MNSDTILPNKTLKMLPAHLNDFLNSNMLKDIELLGEEIKKNQNNLSDDLKKIDRNNPPLVEKEKFLKLFNTFDSKESLKKVYDQVCDLAGSCKNAFINTDNHITRVLDLMKILATAETDIYQLIDQEAIKSNEIQQLIQKWCKEHGIFDDEVSKLLEVSFKRAFTLQTRISDLRFKTSQELSELKQCVADSENTYKHFHEILVQIEKETTILSEQNELLNKQINEIKNKNARNSLFYIFLSVISVIALTLSIINII